MHKELSHILADTYALYLKTQNYHWNVCAPNFRGLHLLFEGQYTELALAIDVIAEHIRALDHRVHASFDFFKANTHFKDGNHEATAEQMIEDLINDHDTLCGCLQDAVKKAQTCADVATEDLLVERIRYHKKTAWMLRSSRF